MKRKRGKKVDSTDVAQESLPLSRDELERQILMHAEHYLSDAKLFYDDSEMFRPARDHRHRTHLLPLLCARG